MNEVKYFSTSIISKNVILVYFLFGLFSLKAQKAAELGFVEGVNLDKNVVFKTVNNTQVDMNIYYPEPSKLRAQNPWILFVHGGGWAGGNKDVIFKKAFTGTFQTLIDSGVVLATVGYRRAMAPVTSYESLLDCKDAARYLIKNAEQYKLDPINYGIWGGSAGGHLSLVTALAEDASFQGDDDLFHIPTNFKFVVSFYPFTSCLNPALRPGSIFEDGSLFVRLLGGTPEEKPELARLLSPTELLQECSPPILLVHGENDPTLPIINSTYLIQVAEEKNAKASLLPVKNAGHSFSGDSISPSLTEITDSCSAFMLSYLRKTK